MEPTDSTRNLQVPNFLVDTESDKPMVDQALENLEKASIINNLETKQMEAALLFLKDYVKIADPSNNHVTNRINKIKDKLILKLNPRYNKILALPPQSFIEIITHSDLTTCIRLIKSGALDGMDAAGKKTLILPLLVKKITGKDESIRDLSPTVICEIIVLNPRGIDCNWEEFGIVFEFLGADLHDIYENVLRKGGCLNRIQFFLPVNEQIEILKRVPLSDNFFRDFLYIKFDEIRKHLIIYHSHKIKSGDIDLRLDYLTQDQMKEMHLNSIHNTGDYGPCLHLLNNNYFFDVLMIFKDQNINLFNKRKSHIQNINNTSKKLNDEQCRALGLDPLH